MFPFNNVILASKSPRRRDLLKQIGISFSIEISGIDESIPLDLPPILMAEYLSKEKAKKISIKFPKQLVIGADTIVVLDNKILGKTDTKVYRSEIIANQYRKKKGLGTLKK